MDRLPLTDPDLYTNGVPHEYFRWLRDHEPVSWHEDPANGKGYWAVVRFDDVTAVSRNWQRYSNARPVSSIEDPPDEEAAQSSGRIFTNQDPPEQARLRKLVSPSFTPGRLRGLVPLVEQTCTRLVDEMLDGGVVDMVRVGEDIALTMVATILGLPPSDWPEVLVAARAISKFQDPACNPSGRPRHEVRRDYYEYAKDVIHQVRQDPDAYDGILPDLVRVEVADGLGGVDRLSDDELLVLFGVTVFGGVETTADVVAESAVACMEYPGLFDVVAEVGECPRPVVEEFLRWRGPVVNFRRTATEDHVLAGSDIRADDKVLMLYPSANWDERHFPHPDVFDPTRDPNDHVGFGAGGPHFCLGAGLARLDIKLMFGELFRRVARFEPAGEAVRLRANQFAGWSSVPVTAIAR